MMHRRFRLHRRLFTSAFTVVLCYANAAGAQQDGVPREYAQAITPGPTNASDAETADVLGPPTSAEPSIQAAAEDVPEPAHAAEDDTTPNVPSDVIDVEPATEPVSVELMFGTNAPLDLAIRARLVVFERLLLNASVGRAVYGGLAGNIAGAIGGDDLTLIVEPAFSNAWIFRIGIGVRPFGNKGPELALGYARMTSSATWDAAAFSLPSSVGALSAEIGLNLLTIELGWSIDVYGPVFVRPAIGWTQVLGADVALSSSVELNGQAASALEDARSFAEQVLVDNGRTPTLSLMLGARF